MLLCHFEDGRLEDVLEQREVPFLALCKPGCQLVAKGDELVGWDALGLLPKHQVNLIPVIRGPRCEPSIDQAKRGGEVVTAAVPERHAVATYGQVLVLELVHLGRFDVRFVLFDCPVQFVHRVQE